MKIIIVLFCVILHTSEIFGQLGFFEKFIETVDSNVTRVRTREERDKRWREFAVLDFIGLVEQYEGYTAEEHEVKTVDGYILKLHRISGSPYSPKADGKPAVLLGHGLYTSSDIFIVTGQQHSLALLLADAGFDVWLANFRGNSYSKRHVKYSTAGNSYDYWNFSMDEMGEIDLPLFVDTILQITKHQKLTYIGYSMGATVSYIFLSSRPEYNDKMNLVLNIAPVAIFTKPLSQLLRVFTIVAPLFKSFAVSNHMYRVLHQSKFSQIIGKDICGMKGGAFFCDNLLKLAARIDRVNATSYPQIFAHIPSGTSVNTVDHYFQMMITGKFRHYDFGQAINKVKYNAKSPPEYDLSRITSPQAIFYAKNDIYANFRDTKTLKSILPNVVAFEKAPDNFNHLDFALHPDARNAIYYKILEIISQYI